MAAARGDEPGRTMTAPEPVRRLSGIESELARTHARTRGGAQVTTLVTVAAVFGSAYLAQVVARWSAGFSALSMRIREEGDALWFHRGGDAGPAWTGQEEMPAARTPADLLAEEVNDSLRPGGPLWRLRIVHDRGEAATHFYLACHPAICDGYTAGRLVRVLLDTLFGEEPEQRGPRPFTEQLLPDCDELSYRALPPVAVPPAPAVPPSCAGPDEGGNPFRARPHGQVVWPLALSPRQSALLKRWCGQHLITVDQFFAAVLAVCFTRATGHDRVDVLTTVSLRQRYAESVRLSETGCCAHTLRTPLRITDGTLVEQARAYAASVAAADAAWRPPRAEPGRRGVPTPAGEAAAFGGAHRLRLSRTGNADTVLGGHVRRVTEFGTVVSHGTYASGSLHLSVFKGGLRLLLGLGGSADDRRVAEDVMRELADTVLRPPVGQLP
ncbi:hypothetical protein NLX86_19585 [Streptomyces sp. A3M-1-3]|uniref:hypothetical protein n=1 Tax=Streptomyces sp. A3M-1-3 TaxID=2962044 RepID=UPI0020B6B14C|nr:hypothetical protein [Streptomyces sp. A3M-1-3]MCP3820220.1 hypothetical protein [Streptomyces sp. A3M-1-3]